MLVDADFDNWFNRNFTITTNRKIKSNFKTKYYAPIDIAYEYDKLQMQLCKSCDKTAIVNALQAKCDETFEANGTDITPEAFVQKFVEDNKDRYSFNSNWTMITEKGDYCVKQITLDDFSQRVIGYNENVTRYKLSADSIRRALINLKSDKMLHGVDDIAKNVLYDKSAEVRTDKILEFCYNWWQIKEDKDIFMTLMKQWMWQVKRFLFNRKVRYHIWLNFRGAAGLGKTEWIRRLCKPFEDVYAQAQVDVLLDSSREIKKLIDNFILNFDELAIKTGSTSYADVASQSDMAIIKSLLTAEVIETRIMGGQTQMRAYRTFSVISSSNDHLYDTFYDPSTMRRYFEFECQVTRITDYKKINKVMSFATDAWRGIDENNDNGYFDPNSDVGKKIAEIQAKYYPTNTTVHAWLEDKSKEDIELLSTCSAQTAYADYKMWCEAEHCHSKTRSNFIDAAKHYGLTFNDTHSTDTSFSDKLVVDDDTADLSKLTVNKRFISTPITATVEFD